MTIHHSILEISLVALPSLCGPHVTLPQKYLPSQIFVRQPSVIHFSWLLIFFGTLSLSPFAPRRPWVFLRVIYLGIYLTLRTIRPDAIQMLSDQSPGARFGSPRVYLLASCAALLVREYSSPCSLFLFTIHFILFFNDLLSLLLHHFVFSIFCCILLYLNFDCILLLVFFF